VAAHLRGESEMEIGSRERGMKALALGKKETFQQIGRSPARQ
jgi:hypothetical protein